ncbi:MAG: FAD-binding oxidoreductase [Candidatus Jordarchaeaceae archaeon]
MSEAKPRDYTKEPDFVKKIVESLHPERMYLKVKEIIQETPSTKTFRMVPTKGKLPPFRAGQYVNLFVKIGNVLTSRPYSISSPPTKTDYIDLTVRRKKGGFVSNYLLDKVKVGDEFETTGPMGQFYYEPLTDGKNLVFLAGGSGITPFMSIIREVVERKLDLNIWLIYGSRVPEDIIFGKELEQIAKKNKNIHYSVVISEPPEGYKGICGFLTRDIILNQIGDAEGKTFYMCGPEAMYNFCDAELASLKLPRRRLKREAYGPPDDVTLEPGWPKGIKADDLFTVEVIGKKTFKARAGEPLMNSLEREGIVIPAVCRSGVCTTCRTKLVSGKVFMPSTVTLLEADRKFGYIHPCMAYPIENIKIRI